MGARKLDRINPATLAANPRAKLSAWLKYESIVKAAFMMHPKTYVYTPANRSPQTIVNHMRDAVRGCLAFNYPSGIPQADLLRWYDEVVFKATDEEVIIGPPVGVESHITGVDNGGPTPPSFKYDTLTFEEICAFTVLLSTGRINGPVQILHPPDITLIPERPNVELLPQSDGSLVML
jgi:hypothetical protein